jgi:predicted phosphohydrolase
MKVQIFSDLHTEVNKSFKYRDIKPLCDTIILAGDLGSLNMGTNWIDGFTDMIRYFSRNWRRVYVCMGNHEYYSSCFSMMQLCRFYNPIFESFSNVKLLERRFYILDKSTIIMGCTLWSRISKETSKKVNALKNINHDVVISDVTTKIKHPITCEMYNLLHDRERKWLIDAVNDFSKNPKLKIIVVTHYPTLNDDRMFHEKYRNKHDDKYDSQFAAHIPEIHKGSNTIFISGHTHYSCDFKDENTGTRFISNQAGYDYEQQYGMCNFNKDGVFEI